jgi:hypothetical protein
MNPPYSQVSSFRQIADDQLLQPIEPLPRHLTALAAASQYSPEPALSMSKGTELNQVKTLQAARATRSEGRLLRSPS